MVHFAVKSGGFHSEKKRKIYYINHNFNCIKLRSSVHMPKCESNCAVNKLITDAFLGTFAYLKFS